MDLFSTKAREGSQTPMRAHLLPPKVYDPEPGRAVRPFRTRHRRRAGFDEDVADVHRALVEARCMETPDEFQALLSVDGSQLPLGDRETWRRGAPL